MHAGATVQLPVQVMDKFRELNLNSVSVTDAQTLETIRACEERCGYMLDPHTAVGVCAARRADWEGVVVCMGCAHAAKFIEVVAKALDRPVEQVMRQIQDKYSTHQCISQALILAAHPLDTQSVPLLVKGQNWEDFLRLFIQERVTDVAPP